MSIPTLVELQDELVERIKTTTSFSRASFDVYDITDILNVSQEGVRWPIAGVAYERTRPLEGGTPTAKPALNRSAGKTLRIEFSVIIATDYRSTGGTSGKNDMLELLHEIRGAVLGFRGVNAKPWALMSEMPLDGDLDGVIFYGQLWATDVVQIGSHVES